MKKPAKKIVNFLVLVSVGTILMVYGGLEKMAFADEKSGASEETAPQVSQPSPEKTEANTVSADAPSDSAAHPGNVTVDFKDADINNVLRILSLKSQVNIVAGPEVQT